MLSYDSISGGQGIFDLSRMVELTAVKFTVTEATQWIRVLKSLSSKKLEVLHLDFVDSTLREKPNDPVWRELDQELIALHKELDNESLRFKTNLPRTSFERFIKCRGITEDSMPFPAWI